MNISKCIRFYCGATSTKLGPIPSTIPPDGYRRAIERYFPEGHTELLGKGFWKGVSETVYIFEVIVRAEEDVLTKDIAWVLADIGYQDVVLCTETMCKADVVCTFSVHPDDVK